jgi:hypothetical protein
MKNGDINKIIKNRPTIVVNLTEGSAAALRRKLIGAARLLVALGDSRRTVKT